MYRPSIDRGIYLNQYYANVLSSKLQRGIKKSGSEKKRNLASIGDRTTNDQLGSRARALNALTTGRISY